MANPKAYGVPPPSSLELAINRDARVRAIRSFMWGLLLDVSAFVVTVLVTAFTSIEWTREYWLALAALLAKTILQASVAYAARKLLPPSNSTGSF